MEYARSVILSFIINKLNMIYKKKTNRIKQIWTSLIIGFKIKETLIESFNS